MYKLEVCMKKGEDTNGIHHDVIAKVFSSNNVEVKEGCLFFKDIKGTHVCIPLKNIAIYSLRSID